MERFLGLLQEYRSLNLSDAINYELIHEALISYHSTALEGSSLTEEETLLLITEGITAKGKPIAHHNMVQDHQKALEWILNKAKVRAEVTPAFIQELSSYVMKNTGSVINAMAGMYDSSKGDWRKSNVYVGTRYFTNFQKVEREVNEFVAWLNPKLKAKKTELEVYNLAFDAHYKLVTIHPFADGNGRTSRLLMNYILAYHNLPLAILYTEDKAEYYNALEECRKGDVENTKPIREFMYNEQIKYLEEEINKYKAMLRSKPNDTGMDFTP
jgi:Fic family protein